jgi:GNAT superfamily N-acetyltransferase
LRIRSLSTSDGDDAVTVINTAAEWYHEFLEPGEIHGPEMTLRQWLAEARRMTWFGAFENGDLVAVMGLEYVEDVALIRHAYVLPHRQRQGIASLLHDHIEGQIHEGIERIIAGTYAANYKARHAFESLGYRLSSDPEAILHRYYQIPQDRLQSSVTFEKSRSSDA